MIKTLSIFFIILLIHLIGVYYSILPGKFEIMCYIDIAITFIFTLGFVIAYSGIKKGAENFSIRFLLTTTLQMLLMLSLILVLAFNKINHVKMVGFTAIILFVILLAIQSYVLIRAVNKK